MNNLDFLNECSKALNKVKETNPLVHHITNYVTVNDCANITLCIGASPVMADSIKEVYDMVNISSSLVINIGTLNERVIESMILAGKEANKKGIPVVLDPVGFSATPYRKEVVKNLLDEVHFDVIKGNSSEVLGIVGLSDSMKGVDSIDLEESEFVKNVAKPLVDYSVKENTVLAITGKVDIIINKDKIIKIYNGHSQLKKITGTGCMTASLIGSYLGAGNSKEISAAAGILTMGISGEEAYNKLTVKNALGQFKANLFDEIACFTENIFSEKAKIDIVNI